MKRKSKGQIAYEAHQHVWFAGNCVPWDTVLKTMKQAWQAAARAVVKACKKKA